MFPEKIPEKTLSVGETLYDLMSANGWKAVEEWRRTANKIAPTLVGGSKNTEVQTWARQEHVRRGQSLV